MKPFWTFEHVFLILFTHHELCFLLLERSEKSEPAISAELEAKRQRPEVEEDEESESEETETEESESESDEEMTLAERRREKALERIQVHSLISAFFHICYPGVFCI